MNQSKITEEKSDDDIEYSNVSEKDSLDFSEIVNYLNKNNIEIKDISTEDGDLEDVFVQLTKH